jgi:hypothetical protein
VTWWCIGLAAVIIGQILNIAVYATIGRIGVYYGTRLGEDIPWVPLIPSIYHTRHNQSIEIVHVWCNVMKNR